MWLAVFKVPPFPTDSPPSERVRRGGAARRAPAERRREPLLHLLRALQQRRQRDPGRRQRRVHLPL